MFSSPAIEANLHRIPGLSKKFIYFNDDVFLGAPTKPEDFLSVSGVQKFHMAWDVPKCAPGCSDSWIGDGFCDRACNVSACNFDFPDCVNATSTGWQGSSSSDQNDPKPFCAKGCPDSWLGDKVCDVKCKNADCGWDMGDCGIGKVIEDFPGVHLTTLNSNVNEIADMNVVEDVVTSSENSSDSQHLHVSTILRSNLSSIPVAISVPIGTKAVYFNFSILRSSLLTGAEEHGFRYISANYTSSDIVHSAAMLTRHDLLLVTLYSEQDDSPAVPVLPHRVSFQVMAESLVTNASVAVEFILEISLNEAALYNQNGYPSGMSSAVRGYSSACALPKSSSKLVVLWKVELADRPFSVNDWGLKNYSDPVVGVALVLALGQISPDAHDLLTSQVFVKYTVTSNSRIYEKLVHVCDAIGGVNSESYFFQRHYSNVSCPEDFETLVKQQGSLKTHNDERTRFDPHSGIPRRFIAGEPVTYLTLLVPIPRTLLSERSKWMNSKVELVTGNISLLSPSADVFDPHGVYLHVGNRLKKRRFHPEMLSDEGDSGMTMERKTRVHETILCASASFQWGVKNVIPRLTNDQTIGNNDTNRVSDDISRNVSKATSGLRRRLDEDTYAQSLIFVNRLYTKKFGTEARKVPAHLPHMIDLDAVSEMQKLWESEWNTTSSNRFRSQKDMQYAFSYYYYVLNRHSIQEIDVKKFIMEEIDTNGDGLIDDNEFRTLTAIAKADIHELYNCTLNSSTVALAHYDNVKHDFSYGSAESTLTIKLWPSVEDVMKCELVVKGLQENINRKVKFQTHITTTDKDVAFEMISDNYTTTLSQLDSIRMRQSKFICINDNMIQPSVELIQALRDFFESFWPTPSRFELPVGNQNSVLQYDKYLALRQSKISVKKMSSPKTFEFVSSQFSRLKRVCKALYARIRISIIKWTHRMLAISMDKMEESLNEKNVATVKQYTHQRSADIHRFRHDHSSDDTVMLDYFVLLLCSAFAITVLRILINSARRSRNEGLTTVK